MDSAGLRLLAWRCRATPPFPQDSRGYTALPQSRAQIDLHLVSDATGETLNSLARACLVQFEGVKGVQHRWSLIRSRFQLDRVIEGIRAEPGPVLYTMIDKSLRATLEAACQQIGVPCLSVLDPVLSMLEGFIGQNMARKPGRQYVLDADYFQRIDAMHYVLAHDDGQAAVSIAAADVVLVGVSRSSKTPTCFYLANRGIKAANVPIVPGAPLPGILDDPPMPVIGLTIDPDRLVEIRRHRLTLITPGVPTARETSYVDPAKVREELLAAKRLCVARRWPVIDVTRRSIEETAATVLQLMESWRRARAERTAGTPPTPSPTGAP
ncbi:MAG: kinase/pyrophosphorylase [Alphaproteobacteria bacterium]|nr:kinase/pyrophosphorylase [Alphaproteobacteria bacterium]